MNNETKTTKLLPAHVPFYKTRRFWIGFQITAYVLVSILITNNIYPGELAVISGLLIPGLFLADFLPEILAAILAGLILTFFTHKIDRKNRLILIGVVILYYFATYIMAIQYRGSFY